MDGKAKMKKVLVANRGEIACRIIRACRNAGLSSVAIYTGIEADALHVSLADEAIEIKADKPVGSYLDAGAIVTAAQVVGADAIHPGYGFLSENADFAAAVEAAGLIFIGPDSATIRAMGDKARARDMAQTAGVPVLRGSRRFMTGELDGLEAAGECVGYPLLVKASGGGGGIGMNVVEHAAELRSKAAQTQTMAARSFGDGTIFLERFIARARHVEVQVFGFGNGSAIHLFERECSIQRRFQKILEESPSPGIGIAVRQRMTEAAVALARTVNYRGAGTIEFIVDGDTGEFFFLEMNTRIQVEHPVTEQVTGTDLVLMQLDLAAGRLNSVDWPQERIVQRGHAIEVRLYAENPERMFLPWPGRVVIFSLPEGEPDIRVETGLRAGDAITASFDPMIAKLIGYGATREEAIANTRLAIAKSDLGGLVSNLSFLGRLLDHDAFKRGETFTSFLTTHHSSLKSPSPISP